MDEAAPQPETLASRTGRWLELGKEAEAAAKVRDFPRFWRAVRVGRRLFLEIQTEIHLAGLPQECQEPLRHGGVVWTDVSLLIQTWMAEIKEQLNGRTAARKVAMGYAQQGRVATGQHIIQYSKPTPEGRVHGR